MIFSQYKETCEVLIYYSKIGEEDKRDFVQRDKLKNITFGLESCCYKNIRPQATNITNIIVKTQGKRERTRGPKFITILVRIIIEKI